MAVGFSSSWVVETRLTPIRNKHVANAISTNDTHNLGKKAENGAMPVKAERNISNKNEGTKDKIYSLSTLLISRKTPICSNSKTAVINKPTTQRLR